MAGALLGEAFDIHGGASTSVFPHHENEIAQSPLGARYAADGAILDAQRLPARSRGRRWAKSEGNFCHDPRPFGGLAG